MKTSGFIPVGSDGKFQKVQKGDIIELITGEKVTFLEMKRVNWRGTLNGKGIGVPIWRRPPTFDGKTEGLAYAKAIVGKDESVFVALVKPAAFKFGDLFSADGCKETFMFIRNDVKQGGRKIIKAYDIATNRSFAVDANMTFTKIDLEKLKKELVNKV
jgi:hypothetical protein